MKKGLQDILWDELKDLFYNVRCYGLPEDVKFDMWSKYQMGLINKIGEESEKDNG